MIPINVYLLLIGDPPCVVRAKERAIRLIMTQYPVETKAIWNFIQNYKGSLFYKIFTTLNAFFSHLEIII